MGTSIIDGTVEDAKLKRARGNVAVYDPSSSALNDGTSRTVKKSVATKAVAEQLAPGTRAAFICSTASISRASTASAAATAPRFTASPAPATASCS